MTRMFLSVADADSFREKLRELRRERSWSISKVASILKCSNRLAAYLLDPVDGRGVKYSYVANLANYLGHSYPPHQTAICEDGITTVKREWAAAKDHLPRRVVARKLEAYLTEFAVVTYRMSVVSTLRIAVSHNPAYLQVVLKNRGSNQSGVLQIHFDLTDQSRLPMTFTADNNRPIFNGYLEFSELKKILNEIYKWQKVPPSEKPRKGPARRSTALARSQQTT